MTEERKYTKFRLVGRTLLNPSGVNLRAFIECDRPATIEEVSELLGDYGLLCPVKVEEVPADEEAIAS